MTGKPDNTLIDGEFEATGSALTSPYRVWISWLSALTGLGIVAGMALLGLRRDPILIATVWGLVVFLLLAIIVLCFFDIFYIRWKIVSEEERKQLEKFMRETRSLPNNSKKGS